MPSAAGQFCMVWEPSQDTLCCLVAEATLPASMSPSLCPTVR